MRVFKFGGASIKDTEAIWNMALIVKKYGQLPLVVVVSAMGKTTRNLEAYWRALQDGNNVQAELEKIISFHLNIINDLFDTDVGIKPTIAKLLDELSSEVFDNSNPDRCYDKIIAYGEILSSAIVEAFLKTQGIACNLIDATSVIATDNQYRSGKVLWDLTEKQILKTLAPLVKSKIVVTQGFIGGYNRQDVVTLGKEGSDYTAAIFASCLNAESVTIWKDVPGVLTADPKMISSAKRIPLLPYKEASEMTYYGATVIHPKTIKPLANKNIPLYVRSFDEPELEPTEISTHGELPLVPSLIYKKNQCLFTFRVRDFTFVEQENLAKIFSTLHKLDISINMLQSSAITISVCFDYSPGKINILIDSLSGQFSMHYNTGLTLITIKNYSEEALEKYRPKPESIILQQGTRANYRFLVGS